MVLLINYSFKLQIPQVSPPHIIGYPFYLYLMFFVSTSRSQYQPLTGRLFKGALLLLPKAPSLKIV